jgi:hypothetical protein
VTSFMVMSDANRHTILRVEVGPKFTSFIGRTKKDIDLHKLANKQFEETYLWQYPEHSIEEFAKRIWGLLEYGVIITLRARKILATFSKEPLMASPVPTPTKVAKDAEAKPVKAPKAAPVEGAEAPKTRGKRIENQKIRLLVKSNPKRPSSASFGRFELYTTCKTTDEFLAAGGLSADLRYDVEHEFIELY